jgi:phospholipid/cholesterol/gamma-HCH transport system substrate-binding protein
MPLEHDSGNGKKYLFDLLNIEDDNLIMDPEFSKKEKMVGIFIVSVTIMMLTLMVIVGRGKDWFKTYVPYYTIFEESYNLKENAAVKLFKTDIGKVTQITLIENKVRVKLLIQEKYASRIRQNSITVVESPTFIGSEYVSIKAGTMDAPLIPKNGVIPSRRKKSVEDFLSEFQVEKTARMFMQAVQNFSEMALLLRSPEGPLLSTLDALNHTIAHTQNIARKLDDGSGTMGNLLSSNDLHIALRSNLDQVETILDYINQAASKTPMAMEQVQNNLYAISRIGKEVYHRVESTKGIVSELESSIALLKVTLANIERSSHDIPEITDSTKDGIQEIRDGVENIDHAVKSFQKNFFFRSAQTVDAVEPGLDAGLRQ